MAKLQKIFKNYDYYICFCVCMMREYGLCTCHGVCVSRSERGQLCGDDLFFQPLCGFWGLNCGHQGWCGKYLYWMSRSPPPPPDIFLPFSCVYVCHVRICIFTCVCGCMCICVFALVWWSGGDVVPCLPPTLSFEAGSLHQILEMLLMGSSVSAAMST